MTFPRYMYPVLLVPIFVFMGVLAYLYRWRRARHRAKKKEMLQESLLGSPKDSSYTSPKTWTMTLKFDNLSLVLKNKQKVLNGVTGDLLPGRCTAVMGPSGAGKTTFLFTLAGRASYGTTTGTVWINGRNVSVEKYRKLVGFVPQDDIMHRELTVKEILSHSARTRLPITMTKQERDRVVEGVLQVLGISDLRYSVVGDETRRGISGGQRKRVNIGMELVADPTTIFLDEPTSGLDSCSSMEVCKALCDTAEGLGVTIVAVVHQPRYETFCAFHDVLLLGKGGSTVYLGPTSEAVNYFTYLGFTCPPHINPADFFLDVISGEVPREGDPDFKAHDLFRLWKESEDWRDSNPAFRERLSSRYNAPEDSSVEIFSEERPERIGEDTMQLERGASSDFYTNFCICCFSLGLLLPFQIRVPALDTRALLDIPPTLEAHYGGVLGALLALLTFNVTFFILAVNNVVLGEVLWWTFFTAFLAVIQLLVLFLVLHRWKAGANVPLLDAGSFLSSMIYGPFWLIYVYHIMANPCVRRKMWSICGALVNLVLLTTSFFLGLVIANNSASWLSFAIPALVCLAALVVLFYFQHLGYVLTSVGNLLLGVVFGPLYVVFLNYFPLEPAPSPSSKFASLLGFIFAALIYFVVFLVLYTLRPDTIQQEVWTPVHIMVVVVACCVVIMVCLIMIHRLRRIPSKDRITPRILVQCMLFIRRSLIQQSQNVVNVAFDLGLMLLSGTMVGIIFNNSKLRDSLLTTQSSFLTKFTASNPGKIIYELTGLYANDTLIHICKDAGEKSRVAYDLPFNLTQVVQLCQFFANPLEDPVINEAVMTSMSIALCAVASSLRVFGNERVVFQRESWTGVSTGSYYVGKTLAHLPTCFMAPLVYLLVYYPIAQPMASFGYLYALFFAIYFTAVGLAYLVSIVVPPSNSQVVGILSVLVCMLLGGTSPTLKQMQDEGLWFLYYGTYISFLRFSEELYFLAESEYSETLQQAQALLFDYYPDDAVMCWEFIIGLNVLFRVGSFCALVLKEQPR